MTKERIARVHRVYGIALSIVIVIAGLCLMAACLGIYRSGDHAFSREAVAAAFRPIALPVYLCLVMVIGAFGLHWLLPAEEKKPSSGRQSQLILRRLHEKNDLSGCDESLRTAIAAQQKSRRLHRTITAVLLALGSILFLVYAVNGDHFHKSEISASMVQAMIRLIPCMAVPFGYGIFTAYHNQASVEKEIALMKQAPAGVPSSTPARKACANQTNVLRTAILVIAVSLLLYGFFTGGTTDVLTKAVNICTECVGLG